MNRKFDKLTRAVDSCLAGTLGRQILFFAGAVVLVFAVLFAGSALFYPDGSSFGGRFWILVHNFLAIGGYDDTRGIGKTLILFCNIAGMVLFGGTLVSILTNVITRRMERVKDGEVFYCWNKHTVIIGFDPMCAGLAKQIAESSPGEIVLLTALPAAAARHELFTSLDEKYKKRITIVSGNRTSQEDMEKLLLPFCTQVFLLGDSGEQDRDARNTECLDIINSQLEGTAEKKRCHVLFCHQSSFSAFQQQDLPDIREHIEFAPFNFCDLWAQKVFVDLQYNSGEITYQPLDREPLTEDSEKHVHLVILGMNSMGVSLGLQAAHLCHFPNFVTKGIKTRITFIDENADREMYFLYGRFTHFFEKTSFFCSGFESEIKASENNEKKLTGLEFEFIKARFEEPAVQQYLANAAAGKDSFLTIAVTLENSAASLACGLYLPRQIYDSGVQVLVRQALSFATLSMLSREIEGMKYRKYKNVKPFGLLDNCYGRERADDILPKMIHHAYKEANNNRFAEEFPLDVIEKEWEDPENVFSNKASSRYCANSIFVKQRSLGITEGVKLSARQTYLAARVEHNRWVAEKLLMGFRAPAPEEDAEIAADKDKKKYYKNRLIHTDIKPYDELDIDNKNINAREYDIKICQAMPLMLSERRRLRK